MADLKIAEKTFDLKQVFRDKSPKLSKWIPGFVYAYLNRKLHIPELNEFLNLNRDKMGLAFIDAAVERIGINFEVTGIDNVPPTGKYTLASNHPLGGPEGLGLLQIIGKVRKDLKFLSNDILMGVPNLKMLFVPVNKHGSNQKNVELFNKAFAELGMLMIFPAGMVSRKIDGKIRDFFWKSSYLTRSIKYNRTVIPVHIDGKNSKFFYNLAYWRTKLGIKANLEMFLLSDEMFKQEGNNVKVTIGKPTDMSIFDDRMSFIKWSAIYKEFVYKLKYNPNLEFNEDYLSTLDLTS